MAKKTKKIDFNDEGAVAKTMAKVLDVPFEDLSISEDSLTSFREGTVYRIEAGRQEYMVVEDEDTAHKLAVAVVKQDLEESPENFETNFIQGHIDIGKLRRELMNDVQESLEENIRDEAKRRPFEFLKENSIDIPAPTAKQLRKHAEAMTDSEEEAAKLLEELENGDAEDQWIALGEEPEVSDSDIESAAEEAAKDQLRDPMSYLEDIFGDEAVKKAIEIAGIDEDRAAEEAVSVDGPGHFLSSYDGNLQDGPGGLVYWRTN